MALKQTIAQIKRSRKNSKQYYANLIARNSEKIATLEHYVRKSDLLKTLKKYFPEFKIEDTTVPKKK